jgi:hypothetical protein
MKIQVIKATNFGINNFQELTLSGFRQEGTDALERVECPRVMSQL